MPEMPAQRLASIALFVFAVVRYWHPFDPHATDPGWFESLNVAKSLTQAGDWANPFQTAATGPTAHLAPAFPLVISLLDWDKPSDPVLAHRLDIFETLSVGLTIALLPAVAEAAGMNFLAGLVAGAAITIVPSGMAPQWESHFAALELALLTLVCLHWWKNAKQLRWAVLAGAVWGITVLTSANALLGLAVFLVLGIMVRAPWRALAACFSMSVILIAPWTVRNLKVLGGFVPIRSNLGLELHVSNSECAAASFSSNLQTSCFRAMHPNESPAEAERLKFMGELAYNRDHRRAATQWISSNPGQFAKLTIARFLLFWFPRDGPSGWNGSGQTGGGLFAVAVGAMTLLSVPGWVLLRRTSRLPAIWFGVWLACFPLVHYLVQFDFRYRYPVLWMSYLLGAHAVVELGALHGRHDGRQSGSRR